MRKKFFSILFIFIVFVSCVKTVTATTTAEAQKQICESQKSARACSGYRSCAWKNNKCTINSTDEKLWNAADCAAAAKSSSECTKCDGYHWASKSSKCIADNNTSEDSSVTNCAEINQNYSNKELAKKTCESNENPKCVWNNEYKFCSVTGLSYLSCGDAKDIPPVVPTLTSYAVNLLKILTPIILILIGIIELVKAMASSNEDSIKKAQSKLIKKVVAAVMVFFVITIVQFVILKVADSGETGSIKKCLKCFLNNDCNGSTYYKDGYGMCYYLDDKSKTCDDI